MLDIFNLTVFWPVPINIGCIAMRYDR